LSLFIGIEIAYLFYLYVKIERLFGSLQ